MSWHLTMSIKAGRVRPLGFKPGFELVLQHQCHLTNVMTNVVTFMTGQIFKGIYAIPCIPFPVVFYANSPRKVIVGFISNINILQPCQLPVTRWQPFAQGTLPPRFIFSLGHATVTALAETEQNLQGRYHHPPVAGWCLRQFRFNLQKTDLGWNVYLSLWEHQELDIYIYM